MLPSSSTSGGMPFALCSCHVRGLSAHISGVTPMAGRDLVERVEVVEMKVSALEELPARVSAVESQIVLLRDEMRGEFSAVRQEMRVLNDETRSEMRALNDKTKAEMSAMNDQTLTHMRVLHEEVLDRIAKLGEGRNGSQRRKRR
jgi:hypothetical protein